MTMTSIWKFTLRNHSLKMILNGAHTRKLLIPNLKRARFGDVYQTKATSTMSISTFLALEGLPTS